MPRIVGAVSSRFKKEQKKRAGVFGKIVSYFKQEHEGYYIVDDERQLVRMYLQGDSEIYQVVCSVGEIDSANITIAQLLKIPKEKIVPACVLANLVNMRTLAAFTVDTDGDLMVTLSLSDKISKITSNAMRVAYLRAFKEAVTYYPAFYQLVHSDIIAEEAYNNLTNTDTGDVVEFKIPYVRMVPLQNTSV